jgi:hypothetical protein
LKNKHRPVDSPVIIEIARLSNSARFNRFASGGGLRVGKHAPDLKPLIGSTADLCALVWHTHDHFQKEKAEPGPQVYRDQRRQESRAQGGSRRRDLGHTGQSTRDEVRGSQACGRDVCNVRTGREGILAVERGTG